MKGFSAIPIFVAVIETGGFSPAARKLGVSKSAVSKRITQLEDQLGVRLLHRTTRKLSLTEAGLRYYELASQVMVTAAQAEDAVTELQGEPQGRLRINVPMSFGRLHVAPVIPVFLERFPKLEINLVMDDQMVDLVGGGFDLAIRAGELPDSALIARKLAPCRHVIVASPEYVAREGRPKTVDELRDHNCLLYSYSTDAKEWTLTNNKETTSIQVSGNYQVNNSEALLEGVRAGTGIGRLPTFVAGPDLKAKRLINLFESYQIADKTLYAVFPEREYLPAKVRVFVDFLIEQFGGEEPYWEPSSH
ncbi:LysR family transcriptional regulator [Motiliproteus sp. MSK22-1]|uniref:LysR family transcriptional regulator n=1 Tax=Motiliproteus sp. MSK22-1 TaxID=1897630 RepID=UPI000977A294|nr:LysR family transcriptional regulator [Motiliproteus sp. MSK22-1]OMH33873.1 LysR family transcriptional regulator [Motiliproteus sp. MSK22-1]